MDYKVKGESLTAIADGFRSSRGTTEKLSLEKMAVLASVPIQSGSGDAGSPIVVGCEVNIATVVSVSTPNSEEYYHNTKLLPEIPAETLASYPYAAILVSTDSSMWLWLSAEKMYVSESETDRLNIPERCIYYGFDSTVNEWVLKGGYTSSKYYSINGSGRWSVWWSNFDIPNGSADAEEIYFPASVPQAEQPADATHFYYNGVRLPEIPEDVLASYPYVLIAKGTETGTIRIYGSTTTTYHGGADNNKIYIPANRVRLTLDQSAMVWGEAEAATTATHLNLDTTWEILWSDHDLPNGSADAEEIYYYGTLAVPDPV